MTSHRTDVDEANDREPTPRTGDTTGPRPEDGFDDLHEPLVGPLSLQVITLAVSAVFAVVGILGFIPGVTTHAAFHAGMRFSGHESHAMLFGIFMVSVLHNLVHLGFAAVGAVTSFFAGTARAYFVGGGVVYLVVWVYGLSVGMDSSANFVPLNTADNWLHLALGVGMIAVGVLLHLRLRSVREDAPRR